MLHSTGGLKPRTIGPGRGGVTDKILHGFDSRQESDFHTKQWSHPPTLQDCILQALVNELVRIIFVDKNEKVGKLFWYSDGKFSFRENGHDRPVVYNVNRVMTVSPIEVDQEATPFLIENMRDHLLASQEKQSRLQIVRRRIRERNNRLAAAAKYNASCS